MTSRLAILVGVLAPLAACTADIYDPYSGLVDRDGDGWADLVEEDVGSDPANPFNWDFGGEQWPDFTDEAGAALIGADFAFEIGKTIPGFPSVDQHGNVVPLHTFFGYTIVLEFTAGWCPPCQDVAADSQQMWVEQRLDGVLVIHQVVDDYQQDGIVRDDFQARWADRWGIEFPVLHEQMVGDDDVMEMLNQGGVGTGAIPLMVVLDHDMKIVDWFEGSGPPAEAATALAIELAAARDAQTDAPR